MLNNPTDLGGFSRPPSAEEEIVAVLCELGRRIRAARNRGASGSILPTSRRRGCLRSSSISLRSTAWIPTVRASCGPSSRTSFDEPAKKETLAQRKLTLPELMRMLRRYE
jgi:hypothetical protein